MEYLGYTEDGSNGENWGNANEDHFNNDKALFDIVISGDTHVHKYALYPDGNRSNPMVGETFDASTGIAKDADRYAVGEIGDDRTFAGFKQWPKTWAGERKILETDPPEGQFRVSNVFYHPSLGSTSVQGVIPVYEPSCGIDPGRKVGGLCQGQQQKRVGGFVIGINLGLLSLFLSEMALKGGYIFYVERYSGFVIGSSNRDMPLSDANSKPVPAISAQDQQMVDRVKWLLEEREGHTITWAEVKAGTAQAEINGEAQFMYVVDYTDFGVDWVGVLSIPWDSVMEDIQRAKWGTLVWGMVIALGIKLVLQLIGNLVQKRLWNKSVYPALDKAAEQDVPALLASSQAGAVSAPMAAGAVAGVAAGGVAAAAAAAAATVV